MAARGGAAAPPPLPPAAELAAWRRDLLRWYGAARRALPWRERPSLYGTWVSEIMLQQTTVAAVVPYWERFLARFPRVEDLAAASEEEVLASWAGLGYYRRARALHAAARHLVAREGGRLPASCGQWRQLPGIGSYAAGAIASIGLGEPVPAVDANARRVLLRWLCATPRQAAALSARALEAAASAFLDPERPGDWNQAVMELGALVCRAAAPACDACPVAARCRAGRAGRAAAIPAPARRPAPTTARLSLLLLRRAADGAVFLVPAAAPPAVTLRSEVDGSPVRAGFAGLYEGLWGLPGTPWYPAPARDRAGDEAFGLRAAAAWVAWLGRLAGRGAGRGARRGGEPVAAGPVLAHAITVYRLRVAPARAPWASGRRDPLPGGRWWRPDRDEPPPLTTLARKLILETW